jgi:pyridinium-3,5-biscarboxylic acid mononucleotide sulfurtransferase
MAARNIVLYARSSIQPRFSSSVGHDLVFSQPPLPVHYSAGITKPTVVVSDKKEATRLVDEMMRGTRDLMRRHPEGKTPTERRRHDHLIAFSGGIDSSLVAALVHHQGQNLGDDALLSSSSVRAVLGISPAVPIEQIHLARTVAKHIGVPLQEVETNEGHDGEYIANVGRACLACKTHLYSTLQAIANHAVQQAQVTFTNSSSLSSTQTTSSDHLHKNTTTNHPQKYHASLYNGTNADDLRDPTRLGLIAAGNFSVLSPIRHFTKSQVREAARHLGLPNWDYAASPCLRSRLALGVPATREHLHRIERAERFVRQQLVAIMGGKLMFVNETSNLRVRLLAQNRACIEVDEAVLEGIMQAERLVMDSWEDFFVGELEFSSVQARAFRSGSVST